MIEDVRTKVRSYEQLLLSVTRLAMVIAFMVSLGVVGFEYLRNTTPTAVATATLAVFTIVIGSWALTRRVFLATNSAPEDEDSDGNVPEPIRGLDYYASLAKSSRVIARGLYDRSGVYLIVGVGSALAGLGVFYIVRLNTAAVNPRDLISVATSFLPATGMLVLMELIAFFFLRQSRAMMDEFRHFEALARHREEVLASLRIAEDQDSPISISAFVENGNFFSRNERLGAGESTEIIEGRKLERTEIDLLEKVVGVVGSRGKA